MRLARAAAAVALLAGVLSGCGSAAPQRHAEADRLPDVTLQRLGGGGGVRLGELRGPMVVNLWASWCTPCRKEMPLYEDFARRHAKQVKVLGIAFQDTRPGAAQALARRAGVTYPLLDDPDGRLRAVGLPKLILLDKSGRIAHEEYVEITSVGQLERTVGRYLGRNVLERSAA